MTRYYGTSHRPGQGQVPIESLTWDEVKGETALIVNGHLLGMIDQATLVGWHVTGGWGRNDLAELLGYCRVLTYVGWRRMHGADLADLAGYDRYVPGQPTPMLPPAEWNRNYYAPTGREQIIDQDAGPGVSVREPTADEHADATYARALERDPDLGAAIEWRAELARRAQRRSQANARLRGWHDAQNLAVDREWQIPDALEGLTYYQRRASDRRRFVAPGWLWPALFVLAIVMLMLWGG